MTAYMAQDDNIMWVVSKNTLYNDRMSSDSDTIRTARRLIELYRSHAVERAQLRADTTGDPKNAAKWQRIVREIRALQPNGAGNS